MAHDPPREPAGDEPPILDPGASGVFPSALAPPGAAVGPDGVPASAPAETPVASVEPSPSGPSLKKLAISGAVWTILGFGIGNVLRFVSSIILTHLLFPEAFGLLKLVYACLVGVHLFTDVGLRMSIIQSKRGEDPLFLNTAWTLQVMRGFLLWAVCAALAWPLAASYGEPALLGLVPLIGSLEAIGGFESMSVITLNRRLLQARLVILDAVVQITVFAVTVIWALASPSVWALAFGGVIGAVLRTALSHLMLPGYRSRFAWDSSAVHELLHFGKWIYFGTACTFLAGQSDSFVVGKFSMALLGVYGLAQNLAQVPAGLIGAFSGQLVFPLYSRLHQEGRDIRHVFGRVHLASAGFAALLIAGLIATGGPLILCLYDPRYRDATWMLPILAVGVWFTVLESIGGAVLWATGQPRVSAFSNGAKTLALPVLLPLGYWLDDIPGMIVGFVAGDLVRYAVTAWALYRQGLPVVRYDLSLTLFIAAASIVAMMVGQWLWPYPFRPEVLSAFAVAPDAGFPGAVPWGALVAPPKRDWSNALMRIGIQGTTVVALWSVAAWFCWSRGMARLGRKV